MRLVIFEANCFRRWMHIVNNHGVFWANYVQTQIYESPKPMGNAYPDTIYKRPQQIRAALSVQKALC